MPATLIRQALVAILFIAILAGTSRGEALQVVPTLTEHVLDQTGSLAATQRQALEQQLTALERAHGAQVVVLMVATTAPEDIAGYANRVANTWKIGRRTVGDGVLVVIAKDDRKMRIEVAKALEGAIPDIAAAHIIDSAMRPRFREGDFFGGLQAAISAIDALIAGERLPASSMDPDASAGDASDGWETWAIFLCLGVALGSPVARALLGNAMGALLCGSLAGAAVYIASASPLLSVFGGLAALIYTLVTATHATTSSRSLGGRWTGGNGSSGWSGGSSDGGFSSGGGGDFGGGGASGDW